MLETQMIEDSNTSGELLVGVECVATHGHRTSMGCRLGEKQCSLCEYLIWLGTGLVSPLPEPVE